MGRAYRLSTLALTTALTIGGGLLGPAHGHDAAHAGRSRKDARIDPRVAYPARLVAAGGGHFHAILIGSDERWLLAGTHLGLFRSVDRGLSWRLVASRFSGEDVHALVRDPVTGRIHAATHGQGLLTSVDDGRSWKDDSAGLPTHDLHALALDPRKPDHVFVWAVGHGLLARTGSEARWRRLAPPGSLADVRALAIHPADSLRLYAATAKGVWVSSDGGRRWQQPPDGLLTAAAGIATIPAAGDGVIAATDAGIFVGDATASRWRPAGAAPQWWGPLVAFTSAPAGSELIALSHEGVVARRSLDEGGEWRPLAETAPVQQVGRQP